ncbi:MAG: response regulator RpfG family c-di-GMP phosphodiesterase [Salibacteraceae bacterium]|jgi:response regulator RpfG family c-di-GMP phosphodiesterase
MSNEKSFNHLKALVVEDSKTALLDMKTKLATLIPKKNIFFAQDYWQAIKLLETQDFDVAFIDLHMPVKTGMDLIVDYVYVNPRTRNLPVIVTTGLSSESLVTHSLKNNTFRYLYKPIDLVEIKEALSNLPLRRNESK